MSSLEMMDMVKFHNTNINEPTTIGGSYESPEYDKIVNSLVNSLVNSGHDDVFKSGGNDIEYIDDKMDVVSDKIDDLRNEYIIEIPKTEELQHYSVMVDFIKNYISKINVNSFKSNN